MKSNNNPTNLLSNTAHTGEIKRYLRIAQKRKWLILISSTIILFVWVVYAITFQSQPVYTATALLTFEDPRNISAVTDYRSSNIGKAGLIKSTSLLNDVTKILKLNVSIRTENLGKDDVFEYLRVDEATIPGEYKLVKQGIKYDLFFKNEEIGLDEKKLLSFQSQDTVRINKMDFLLASNVAEPVIEFRIKTFESTVQNLKNQIEFNLDRSKTLLSISGTFSSPNKAADIVNILVDNYLELLRNMQRFKTNEVIKILDNEMELAKNDLEIANNKLKQFREQYPWVSLTPTASGQITQIGDFESSKHNTSQRINDLKTLNDKLDNASDLNEKIIVTQEILTYLGTEERPLIPAFKSQYAELNSKRNLLLSNYAPSHPLVTQNEEEFLTLIRKIRNASEDHIVDLRAQIDQITSNIQEEKIKIKKLPLKEIELAELLRDKDVKNNLYGTILTRYNRAKIQNEVEVSDVSIIDRAAPPPLQSVMSNLIRKALLGVFVALGGGLGLAVVFEFFSKTVENVEELRSRTKFSVIGSIPLIENENDKSGNFQDQKNKKETKLITLDYSPTFESEAYRDLRTKILYMNQNRQSSSFLITSLKPGEGKSLTASNIAVTFAQQKITTVLIDGDIRRGVLHNVFGNKKKPGLSDFIVSNATIDYANINKLIQSTFVPNLFLITAGSPVPNPTELHGSERMRDFINVLKSRFGMVIIDTPPFRGGSDSIILSNVVDSIIILVRANFTNVDELEEKIGQYPFFHDKILGVILNMAKIDSKKTQYQYTYYHY